jgi:uncharacterized lipoprotein YmbA
MNACKTWMAPVVLLAAGALAGCASSIPAPALLTLPMPVGGAAPAAAPSPAPSASTPLLAVRRIGIPEYLVARRVRYRADPSTLAEWPNTYWGERIEIGVARQFVGALRRQLPGWSLCDTNCGDRLPVLTLQVDIAPMDYVRSARQLEASARISVSGVGADAAVLQVRELNYAIPAMADTAQAQAVAIGELIERLAADTAPLIAAAAR